MAQQCTRSRVYGTFFRIRVEQNVENLRHNLPIVSIDHLALHEYEYEMVVSMHALGRSFAGLWLVRSCRS